MYISVHDPYRDVDQLMLIKVETAFYRRRCSYRIFFFLDVASPTFCPSQRKLALTSSFIKSIHIASRARPKNK